jgi:hypothetical protein
MQGTYQIAFSSEVLQLVLPAKAAELAEMDDNLLMQGTYLLCVFWYTTSIS